MKIKITDNSEYRYLMELLLSDIRTKKQRVLHSDSHGQVHHDPELMVAERIREALEDANDELSFNAGMRRSAELIDETE